MRLAERFGIQSSYIDMAGLKKMASPDSLKEVLRLHGVDVDSRRAIEAALRDFESRHWREVLPAVSICWDHHPCKVELRLPGDTRATATSCRLILENGDAKELSWDPQKLRSRAAASC